MRVRVGTRQAPVQLSRQTNPALRTCSPPEPRNPTTHCTLCAVPSGMVLAVAVGHKIVISQQQLIFSSIVEQILFYQQQQSGSGPPSPQKGV